MEIEIEHECKDCHATWRHTERHEPDCPRWKEKWWLKEKLKEAEAKRRYEYSIPQFKKDYKRQIHVLQERLKDPVRFWLREQIVRLETNLRYQQMELDELKKRFARLGKPRKVTKIQGFVKGAR